MVVKARITSKKQLTLPAKLFRAAGLKEGQEIAISLENGRLVLTPPEQMVEQLAGILNDAAPSEWKGRDIDLIIEEARKTYFRRYYKKV